jgi:hypothetical protein
MTDDKEDFDRKQKKTQKIVLFLVVPVLIVVAVLLVISELGVEEKPSYTQILSQIDLHCYNVNWFGIHGFQITYMDTITEIAEKLDGYNMDFGRDEFFENQGVVDHLVVYCPHVDSRLQVPDIFDPSIGTNVVDKCLERKIGTIGFKETCDEFIK